MINSDTVTKEEEHQSRNPPGWEPSC